MPIIDGHHTTSALADTYWDMQPNWAVLYAGCRVHTNGTPTVEQLEFCRDWPAQDHAEVAFCYACSWEDCQECPDTLLTPRSAATLYAAAVRLGDELRRDLASTADRSGTLDLSHSRQWMAALPPAALQQMTNPRTESYLESLERMAAQLSVGKGLSTMCVGEQAALRHLVGFVEQERNDPLVWPGYLHWLRGLPHVGDDDAAFAWVCGLTRTNDAGLPNPTRTPTSAFDVDGVPVSDWFKPYGEVTAPAVAPPAASGAPPVPHRVQPSVVAARERAARVDQRRTNR